MFNKISINNDFIVVMIFAYNHISVGLLGTQSLLVARPTTLNHLVLKFTFKTTTVISIRYKIVGNDVG